MFDSVETLSKCKELKSHINLVFNLMVFHFKIHASHIEIGSMRCRHYTESSGMAFMVDIVQVNISRIFNLHRGSRKQLDIPGWIQDRSKAQWNKPRLGRTNGQCRFKKIAFFM